MAGTSATGGRAASEFHEFLSEEWAWWLEAFPEYATQVGQSGFDDRWTDDSPAGIERRRARLIAGLERVRSFDPASLAPEDRLSLRLYRESLELAVAGLAFGDDPSPFRSVVARNLYMPLSQMEGIHVVAAEILECQPRARPADVEAYLRRLAALPVAVDQQIALLREGLRHGYSPAAVAVRGVPDQLRGLLAERASDGPILRPLDELPAGIPPERAREFRHRAEELWSSTVRPAFERLLDFVVREYLPACRSEIAATSLPSGAAGYAHRVRWQTTTERSPKEIHELGRREVARVRGEMEQIARSTGFAGSLAEFHEQMRTDPKFRFDRPEALVEAYRALAKRIDPELPRLFGRLPRLPYGVLPVPAFRAPASPAAYYQPGAAAVGRPGLFFANTHDLPERPRWEMAALALHEAVPGHHLQIALSEELVDLPEFRRFASYGAYVEGWALYAESLGETIGLYDDPTARYGQLVFDLWRSARLVVDTGMHALGWSREQAIQFLREHTGKSDHDIAVEVDRYIVWPGQALCYKVGQLKIHELRSLAERSLGERFDVRAFHDRILGDGALPLGVLEERLGAWIDAGPGQGPSTG